jgi:hypothetical protein
MALRLNILFNSPSVLFFLEIFSAASTPCTPPIAHFSVDIRACHRIIGFCADYDWDPLFSI